MEMSKECRAEEVRQQKTRPNCVGTRRRPSKDARLPALPCLWLAEQPHALAADPSRINETRQCVSFTTPRFAVMNMDMEENSDNGIKSTPKCSDRDNCMQIYLHCLLRRVQQPRGLKITTSRDERMVKISLTGLGRGLRSDFLHQNGVLYRRWTLIG